MRVLWLRTDWPCSQYIQQCVTYDSDLGDCEEKVDEDREAFSAK